MTFICERTPTFSLVVSRAKMPSSCKGQYNRIGIIKHDADYKPKQIRNTAKGKIYKTWERLNVGSTDRCAFAVALREAQDVLQKLKKEAAQ